MNTSSKIARRFVRLCLLGCIIPLLFACGSGSNKNLSAMSNTTPATGTSTTTPVITGTITEFPASSDHSGIATGTDGNLWFGGADNNGNSAVIRMTPSGIVTAFKIPTFGSSVVGITAGPDRNLWFTLYGGSSNIGGSSVVTPIGRITPTGTITMFTIPGDYYDPQAIIAGPDGNLWFTLYGGSYIGRMTPTGSVTEFQTTNMAQAITTGPDGNLWFTEANFGGSNAQIGRMTPSGNLTEFPLPSSDSAKAITTGPDGNLWFTEPGVAQIGRMTPSGSLTEFPIPRTVADSSAIAITTGPDGNLWFTEVSQVAQIGRMTPSGSLTEFPVTPDTKPQAITTGPDHNLWFTEDDTGQIGQFTVGKP